jgi:hypothetical protein
MEAKVFWTNTMIIITKFLYEYTLTKFKCLLTLVMDQGIHLLNNNIIRLVDHFLLQLTYYFYNILTTW